MFLFLMKTTNSSSYDTKKMIEMDQFVVQLSGEEEQLVRRKSTESAATMKESGMTLKRLVNHLNCSMISHLYSA